MTELELPGAFRERMAALMDPDTYQTLMDSYSQPRFKGIRTNTLKCSNDEMCAKIPFEAEKVPWCPTGYYIDPEVRPGKNPAYYVGLYYVQEPTAMIPAEALSPEPGDWVLDLCAAPGGKTTQLACKLMGKGLLVANELVKNRAAVLASNMERMGIANSLILNEFPERLDAGFHEAFDKILVDAPCSGEGMFRKEPAALSEWSVERVCQCAARQKKILETVDGLLKPGGVLVYSTCTFAPEENEQVVEALLATGRYTTEPIILPGLSGHGHPQWTDSGDERIGDTLRVMPGRVKGEGHFVARLRKTASLEEGGGGRRGKGKNKAPSSGLTRANRKELAVYKEFADPYLRNVDFGEIATVGDRLYALPAGLEPWRLSGLHVLRCGVYLGELKKNRFEPSHTLAMALKPENFSQVRCTADDGEAYAYLKGEPLPAEAQKGWTLVCWQGHPLGFGKASQGMIKNHFPKGLRIYKK